VILEDMNMLSEIQSQGSELLQICNGKIQLPHIVDSKKVQ